MSFEDIFYNIKFGDDTAAHFSCFIFLVALFACLHVRISGI